MRRGLGLLPGGPSPAPTLPAPPAAARTPGWPHRAQATHGDRLVLPSIGKTRARRGLSPKLLTPQGAGVAEMKTEKVRRPHRRGDPSPYSRLTPPGLASASTTTRDYACAAVAASRGGASVTAPTSGQAGGSPLLGCAPRVGRGQGGPGSGRASLLFVCRIP